MPRLFRVKFSISGVGVPNKKLTRNVCLNQSSGRDCTALKRNWLETSPFRSNPAQVQPLNRSP